MSVASAINIFLQCNNTQANTAIAQTESKLVHFGSVGERVAGGLEGVFGLVVGALAGFSLEHEFEEIEKLGRVSERLDILPEHLAGMKLAAGVTGVAFEDLTTSMQKMMLNISEVSHGGGEKAAKALEQLGLSAETLRDMKPEDQMGAIADALQKVSNAGDRVDIAKSIFGKGGIGMLNVLKDGKKGLQEWQKSAEDAGLALSKIDVEKVAMANEATKKLKATFEGLTQHLLVALTPAITSITTFIKILGEFAIKVWNKWGGVITTVIEIMVAYKAVMWSIIAAQRAWTVAVAIHTAVATGGWAAILKIVTGITAAGGAVLILNDAFDDLEKKYKDMKNMTLPKLDDPGAFDIPDPGGGKNKAKDPLADALKVHPGAYQKGSVEAYSASLKAGAKNPFTSVEHHTKRAADLLASIDKENKKHHKNVKPKKKANLGGK